MVRRVEISLKVLAGVIGLVAAVLWLWSAWADLPPAPGAAIGGTSPTDPFNIALRHVASLNGYAALATGVSVLLNLSISCDQAERC
jgi:hypothetical protein